MKTNSDFVAALQSFRAAEWEAAEESCRRVTADSPQYGDALNLLALIEHQKGDLEAAIALLDQAIKVESTRSSFHNNLANILKQQQKLEAAIASYRTAYQLAPLDETICSNLGAALQLQGNPQEAIVYFQRAVALNPKDTTTLYSLGAAFTDLGRLDLAAPCLRRAWTMNPNEPAVLTNLGILCQHQGKLSEAAEWFHKALVQSPNSASVYNNLGAICQDLGRNDATIAYLRKAMELQPGDAKAHSNLLVALQYREGVSLAELATEHIAFDRQHTEPLYLQHLPLAIDFDPQRPLRLGFVSPNFCQHPIGHFVVGAIENLNPEEFQVICYSERLIDDEWTTRFRKASATWRETSRLTDAELAAQIRADRVDILFDLAGHTARNRLLTCARRPAPVQITWADYVGTTGLAAMDYLLADGQEVPPESESFFRERVLRMPHGYVCYEPPPYAPPVGAVPAVRSGFVTFGSFNYRPKISPRIVEVWSRILREVPGSRLVLKYRGMDDAAIAGPLKAEFARQGVQPDRIECLGWSAHADLLGEYQRIDLALDTFPYNGGLTTCEALWMGVPVITCPGETFASRHSLSHMSNVGFTETIAQNFDQYVALAVQFANDLPRLEIVRRGLRERMAASPLCDSKRFAQDLMLILRDIWRQRCEKR